MASFSGAVISVVVCGWKQVANMGTNCQIYGLAASKDEKWFAGGTSRGEVILRDATTREQVWSHTDEDDLDIFAVVFSPGPTRHV